jgi:hypothetical protein
MNDLLDKLKALGLNLEKARDIQAPVEDTLAVEQVIAGEWIDQAGGRVFVLEKVFPLGHMHGNIAIRPPQDFNFLSQFMGIDAALEYKDLLFVDTETSSLSTGAGSFVFLIGMAYFVEEGLKIVQIFLEHPNDELPFLACLDDYLADFNTFVSYNGKAFDIPMLKSRYVMNKLPSRLTDFHHFDLLHTARRIWKLRLESRKLGDIEKEILAFTRGSQEIPGWLVPQMYFDYLDSGDAAPLKGVFYHNEVDVISLAALFIHINDLLHRHPDKPQDGLDSYSIAYTLGKLGIWKLSEDFYKAGLENELPEEVRKEAARNFALTLKRQGKWAQALDYWKFAADNGDFPACIELAKYYEHREKDVQQALQWVEIAITMTEGQNFREKDMDAIRHRKDRLERKMRKENGEE